MAIKSNVKMVQKSDNLKVVNIIENIIYYTFLFLLILSPIIVYLHSTDFVSSLIDETGMGSKHVDETYGFIKAIILWVCTGIISILFTIKLFLSKRGLIQTKYNYFVSLIFVLFSISLLFSPFKNVAFFGGPMRYVGALTYFCYFILFIILVNLDLTKKKQYGLVFALLPFLLINVVLGILYNNGVNIYFSPFTQALMGATNISWHPDSHIQSTLPNPNYISGASGFIFGLFFSLCLLLEDTKIKIAALVLSILSITVIFTSVSTSGFVVATISFVLAFIFSLILKKDNWKSTFIYSGVFILLSSVIFTFLASSNEHVWNESFGRFFGTKSENISQTKVGATLKNSTKEDSEAPKTNGESSDGLDKEKMKELGLPEIPTFKKGSLNGRIYIWEKTLEVWSERPLLGHGLETLGYYFDQHDIRAAEGLGANNVSIDKPHSLYLSWLYGTGIFTCISILALFGVIILEATKQIIRKKVNPILVAAFIATLGFLLQGIVNDAEVGSSVIAWILLGLLGNQLVRFNENQHSID